MKHYMINAYAYAMLAKRKITECVAANPWVYTQFTGIFLFFKVVSFFKRLQKFLIGIVFPIHTRAEDLSVCACYTRWSHHFEHLLNGY